MLSIQLFLAAFWWREFSVNALRALRPAVSERWLERLSIAAGVIGWTLVGAGFWSIGG